MQAAPQFYKMLVKVLIEELNFKKSLAEPYLLMRENDLWVVIFCIYVNDILCIGEFEAVNNAKTKIKKFFNITNEGEMKEYVGCSVKQFH